MIDDLPLFGPDAVDAPAPRVPEKGTGVPFSVTLGCPFCGGDRAAPDHAARCDGRQGHVEAAIAAPPIPAFDPFAHARTGDPDTSIAAALAVDATEVQQRVWAIFREHPEGLTDEELVALYTRAHPGGRSLESRSSPRKRRSDLALAAILVDSGTRRRLTSGRHGIVWTLARVAVGS